jgi:biopolymer transport protein TolR
MRREKPRPDMNVTPLVDVVLVLLIIFMVIAPQMEAGAKVDLPKADNVDPKNENKLEPITVTVDATGKAFLEDESLDRDELIDRLTAIHEEDASRKVVLRADRATRYSEVRDLFKRCRDVGFAGVALQVGEQEKKRGS